VIGENKMGVAYILIPIILVTCGVLICAAWWFRSTLVTMDLMNWLHGVSIVIGLAQMIFILCYYVPLMQWRYGVGYSVEDDRDKFISDFLFTDSVYRAVMTGFVALQLGVCALFVTRLRSNHEDGPVMYFIEVVLFLCAWIGWTTLCSEYVNPSGGGMSVVHEVGVGIYIACSLVYVCMMTLNVRLLFNRMSHLASAEFALLVVLLLTSICLGCHFIYNALRGDPDAWVTEHLAFVFFVACHMVLFFLDSNYHRTETLVTRSSANGAPAVFDGVRIQIFH